MSADLEIDLRGIEHKFSAKGERVCADCGFDFDASDAAFEDEGEELKIPLLLWKDDGRLMLTLCFPCAQKRTKNPNV